MPSPESDAARIAAEDLALLRDAALSVGPLLRAKFGADYAVWSKGAAGPVTEVDIAVDRMLRDFLTAARPDYGWLSEETADNPDRLERASVFVVDPIDGTRAFIKRKPEFCTALSVVRHGAPVAGVVYNPILEELFEAADGHGARLNGERVTVSATADIENCRMLGPEDLFANKFWPRPWPAMQRSQKNAIAYRVALVSSGDYDATVSLGYKSEWDIAAAAVIVREAGGRISDPWNGDFSFNKPDPRLAGVVCANPALHALLIDRVTVTPHPSTFSERPA
ncbi:MAG: 3'(2'),5'-bisphosphate nucleotidase CysQ [Hyphomonadaceae bacterium]|nr:3'(2'),5'-bisphosphate nucleotidase CysQ [Hyphomonadaceae bacterium]